MNKRVQDTDLWCPVGHFNVDQADKYRELCAALLPQTAIEIGFGTGRSAACVLYHTVGHLRKMVSIEQDLDFLSPKGRVMARRLEDRYPTFRVIEGWSRDVLTPEFVRREFPDGIDLATIDGDHTYEGCAFDLGAIVAWLNDGAMMIVDDYRSGPPNGVAFPEVTKCVDDFLDRHRGDSAPKFGIRPEKVSAS